MVRPTYGQREEADAPLPHHDCGCPVPPPGPHAPEGQLVSRTVSVVALIVILAIVSIGSAFARRSGCHRWHSCPSDRGTYVCGDLGHCSQCPDNDYCERGKPRAKAQKEAPVEEPKAAEQPKAQPPKAAPVPVR